MNYDETKHKRDSDGKFTYKNGESSSDSVKDQIAWARKNGKELPLNTDGSLNDMALQKMYEERKNSDRLSMQDLPSPRGNNDNEETAKSGSQEEIDTLLGEEFKGVKGQASVDKLLKEKRGHVKGAFHRDDIGDIDLLWGNEHVGLRHILEQREKQGINGAEFINDLSQVVEKGAYMQKNDRGNFEFIHNGKMAIIAPEYHGNKITFVLTAYKTRKKSTVN